MHRYVCLYIRIFVICTYAYDMYMHIYIKICLGMVPTLGVHPDPKRSRPKGVDRPTSAASRASAASAPVAWPEMLQSASN